MNYHDITKDDMKNGDGLRVVLWLAGCSHKCKGCHNPITWDPNGGLFFNAAAKQELFEQLKKDYIAGITFSGGDPLHPANKSEVYDLMKEIKEKYPDKTIWVYTGYTWEYLLKYSMYREMLSYIDVLVDGKFEKDKQDNKLLWKGSSNQRVIDVQATLKQNSQALLLHCMDYMPEPFVENRDYKQQTCEG